MADFTIVIDHCPLKGIFEKPLASMTNDRLQRICEKLIMFNFNIEWRAGKIHLIADALNRALYFPADTSLEVKVSAISTDDPSLEIIKSNVDKEYINIRSFVLAGGACPSSLSSYGKIWSELSV